MIGDTSAGAEMATYHLDSLVDELTSRGLLRTEQWKHALTAVPRHLFAPSVGWAIPCEGGPGRAIHRQARENDWWTAVYSDSAIVTQADDGATDPASGRGIFSSSLSAPGVVVAFLEMLDVDDNNRVLEIGTGTGWTAGLLSSRVGEENVTSVEVDASLADQAAANLRNAGYAPHLIVGDGAEAWPSRAPYDRVHATCAVTQIPYTWVEQTRPGGVIVLPWSPGTPVGHRVRLDVLGDGTALGRFTGPAGYMMMRAQRRSMTWNAHHPDASERRTTRLDPRAITRAGPGADLAITAQVPELGLRSLLDDDGSFSLLLFQPGQPAGSWAACDYTPGADEFDVTQYGDRRLWDEVADAYLRWLAWNRPGSERFGLTLSREGQHMWLDRPDNVLIGTRST